MKAFGYCRVSSKTQSNDDKDGFPRQRLAIDKYAKANGIEIAGWFEDAYTGTELNRPQFKTMRTALLADGVRTVIVEKLDRLARDLLVQETILADFRKNDLTLISTAEPDLCSDDPSRKFFRQIMGAVAEYDRAMLVSRMKAGKERVRRTGKSCGGRRPYSSLPQDNALISRAQQLHSQGLNLSAIARILNAEGYTSLYKKRLYPVQISRILRSQPL